MLPVRAVGQVAAARTDLSNAQADLTDAVDTAAVTAGQPGNEGKALVEPAAGLALREAQAGLAQAKKTSRNTPTHLPLSDVRPARPARPSISTTTQQSPHRALRRTHPDRHPLLRHHPHPHPHPQRPPLTLHRRSHQVRSSEFCWEVGGGVDNGLFAVEGVARIGASVEPSVAARGTFPRYDTPKTAIFNAYVNN